MIPSDNCAHFIEISLNVYGEDLLSRPWQTSARKTCHLDLGQSHQKNLVGAEQKAEAAEVVAQGAVGYTHKTVLALA